MGFVKGKSHRETFGEKKSEEIINMLKERKGIKNPNWKGDNIGYNGIHSWARKYKPKPIFCENCGKNKSYDLANISGGYKRDLNDWKWLCRGCHMKEDGRINNFNNRGLLKGIKLSEEHKRKIGEALIGKKFTKEHRENLSKAKKKMYENGYINPMKNKKRNDLSAYNKRRKGKTMEEIFGFDKAQEIKRKLRKNNPKWMSKIFG